MILTIDERQRAFGYWLRTGRLPTLRDADGVERKFNPWHDPDDGRFTFAGSGRYYGNGEGKSPDRPTPGRSAAPVGRGRSNVRKSTGQPTGAQVQHGSAQQAVRSIKRSDRDPPNPVAEFARGAGEGMHQTGKDAAEGLYSALTTDPRTTARNIGRSAAAKIDAAIAAEDIPAHEQIARAARAAKNASARDLGRAFGSAAANTALTVVPGAAAARVSALRHANKIRVRETIPQPEYRWVKEALAEGKAKDYNDAAPGARPGEAPALKLTMPDGSERWVKFDAVTGEYLTDRKRAIYWSKKARNQGARQSEALRQNNTFATWEVPNEKQRKAARRFFEKNGIKNIKVRIAKE